MPAFLGLTAMQHSSKESMKVFYNAQSSKEPDYHKILLDVAVATERMVVLNEVDDLLVAE